MLININYEGNLASFMNKKYYKLEDLKIFTKKKNLPKIGFYLVIIKKPFLVYYEYLENLIRKMKILVDKKRKFKPKNSLNI